MRYVYLRTCTALLLLFVYESRLLPLRYMVYLAVRHDRTESYMYVVSPERSVFTGKMGLLFDTWLTPLVALMLLA
jgi:hypothetical protein